MKKTRVKEEKIGIFAKEMLAVFKKTSAKKTGAFVVGLSGNLGAGKTAFTKALGSALGIKENITSPTFVLARVYPTKDPLFKELVHVDAYRLKDDKEFSVLKLERELDKPKTLILIEWPERIPKDFPLSAKLEFNHAGEKEREVILHI